MLAAASQPIDMRRPKAQPCDEAEPADFQAGSLSDALLSLKLQCTDEEGALIDRVLHVLADVVSGPSIMMSFGSCSGREARWWDCFAEVYEREVEAQTRSGGSEPSSAGKRQILADILVWAEITQDHYDTNTLQFVTGPHMGDASFQRIGQLLAEVKQHKGLGSKRADQQQQQADVCCNRWDSETSDQRNDRC